MSRTRSSRIAAVTESHDGLSPGDSRGVSRTLTALAWLVALATVALALNRLEPIARGLSTSPTRIEWANLPNWLQEPEWTWVLTELEQIPEFGPDTDIYSKDAAAWVAKNVYDSPWIEHIDRVTKLADGRVRVYAHFRKPFTMIEKDGSAYLIDESGVRLPGRLASKEVDYSRGLTITGVRADIPPEGQLWPGADLQDGIKLVRFLWQAEMSGSLPIRSYLRSVDVSGSRTTWDGPLKIITTKPGNYIHWGLPPHEEYNIEADARRKLEALCEETRVRKWLDGDRPIDIRAGEIADKIITPP